ncbi:MAG: hypothetical protein HIU83_00230 [Proteobacteria bacterium]|nr:hypothetical protein [Pseudomonadota bacterium]
MQYATINKLKPLLLLLLALLNLQFGIVLLHHHYNDSFYDHTDPTHHICTNPPTLTKWGVTTGSHTFPSYHPVLLIAAARIAAPDCLILGRICPKTSIAPSYQPITSFPTRASPA